jgi:hypothetical protein
MYIIRIEYTAVAKTADLLQSCIYYCTLRNISVDWSETENEEGVPFPEVRMSKPR